MDKIALIFPGQGSHYIGMGKSIYEGYSCAKKIFEEANDTLGYNIAKLCFEGGVRELNRLENMLPAIFTVSVALFNVYKEEIGVLPHFMAGHSLGEYSALTCSEALKFSDALRIIRRRSELAKDAKEQQHGAMSIIEEIDETALKRICSEASSDESNIGVIACYNSDRQFTVCGHEAALLAIEDMALDLGALVTPIISGTPFHSPLMKSILKALEEEINKYSLSLPRIPVISNCSAMPYEAGKPVFKNLIEQISKPVRWRDTVNYLVNMGVKVFIDIGPQSLLKNLVKTIVNNDIQVLAFNQQEDRPEILSTFMGKSLIKTVERDTIAPYIKSLVSSCLAEAVCARNCNWNEKEYEEGVLVPYSELEAIQNELDKNKLPPTIEQMQNALEKLFIIFDTKKVPNSEQQRRIKRILGNNSTSHIFSDFIERRYGESERI